MAYLDIGIKDVAACTFGLGGPPAAIYAASHRGDPRAALLWGAMLACAYVCLKYRANSTAARTFFKCVIASCLCLYAFLAAALLIFHALLPSTCC